jgi:hypothetical protein
MSIFSEETGQESKNPARPAIFTEKVNCSLLVRPFFGIQFVDRKKTLAQWAQKHNFIVSFSQSPFMGRGKMGLCETWGKMKHPSIFA